MASKEAGQNAVKQAVSVGSYATGAMFGVSLLTGIAYANAPCDMDLAEWNLVASALLGVLSATMFLIIYVAPKAIQNAYNAAIFESGLKSIVTEGVFPASLSMSLILLPALLFVWDIHGLMQVRFGTCPSSAPVLFDVSLVSMIAQLVLVVGSVSYVMHASGFTWDTAMSYMWAAWSWVRTKASVVCDWIHSILSMETLRSFWGLLCYICSVDGIRAGWSVVSEKTYNAWVFCSDSCSKGWAYLRSFCKCGPESQRLLG